jgi:hypothetical protein
MSLIRGIVGWSRVAVAVADHNGPALESQMQGMKQGWMRGVIANNAPGSPATLPTGGLTVEVVTSAIALAAAAR